MLGARTCVGAGLAAAVPAAFVALARRNNPDLLPTTADAVVRAGIGVGLACAVAGLAEPLLARRPPWPWSRSLPWSAAERVGVDLVTLAAPALVIAVAAAATLGARHLLPAMAVVLVTAAGAAGALRVGAGRQFGAAGETLAVGVTCAVAVAVWPALVWGTPVVAVALAALARRRDHRAPDAVRWNELRHGVDGDVGWLSRP